MKNVQVVVATALRATGTGLLKVGTYAFGAFFGVMAMCIDCANTMNDMTESILTALEDSPKPLVEKALALCIYVAVLGGVLSCCVVAVMFLVSMVPPIAVGFAIAIATTLDTMTRRLRPKSNNDRSA